MMCVHRWILSEPSRGSVNGTCRRCGAQRSYPAGIQLPPPPEEPEEEEEVVVLEGPALAASIASMERHVLV
jgi:hypothetical protein